MKREIVCRSNACIDGICAFINPDNESSMRLHSKAGFNIEDWKIAVYEAK